MVPFNSFSEFNKAEGGDVWFALDETRPLICFAGIWTKLIKALIPPPPEGPDSPEAQPGPRIMHGPDAPQFHRPPQRLVGH